MRIQLQPLVEHDLSSGRVPPYLCCGGGSVRISLVVQALKLLQTGTRPLCQAHNDCLASIIPERQPCWGPLLRRFKKIIDFVIVYFVVAHKDFNLRCSFGILLNFSATTIDTTQKPWDHSSISQTFTASHRMRLSGPGDSVGEYRYVESIEEVFYCGSNCRNLSAPWFKQYATFKNQPSASKISC